MAVIILLLNINLAKSQNIATFDDLQLTLNSYWNGSDSSGGFNSGNVFFENKYTSFGGGAYAWTGFAYSNTTDTLTNGYTNQFSAITGKGALNSANYAVSYVNYDYLNNYSMTPNVLRFTTPKSISGFYATNSTYAYFSMLNGDGALAKKFGGTSGNDSDWLKLQIKGYRNGIMIDTVNCFLADFRFTNNAEDFIAKNWRWVDLSSLGNIDSLTFGLTSSDMGSYGMNTPAYFCMDNFNGTAPTSINDFNDLQINIYPNPFTKNIYIKLNDNPLLNNISIFDVSGKEIVSKNIVANDYTVNLSFLTEGIYFVKVTNKKSSFFSKIIKQ